MLKNLNSSKARAWAWVDYSQSDLRAAIQVGCSDMGGTTSNEQHHVKGIRDSKKFGKT